MALRPRFSATFAALLALTVAACDVEFVPNVAPKSAPAAIAQAPDGRVSARNFLAVVQTVEPVAESICRSRAPRLNCDFRIVVDDRPNMPPNAFQTVDEQGRPIIAFTLALIADARNVDELAFVMAHEAAHHIAGHLERQRQNATMGALVFGQLAGVTGGGADAVRVAQELGAQVGARSYSKDFELEADALGTRIAARAGYDPLRGAEFFFRIPDPGDRFLGTHPPNADRIEIVRRTVAGL
ncbi:MAG: M48 family metallopeptidase [Octadecabacter sp.]